MNERSFPRHAGCHVHKIPHYLFVRDNLELHACFASHFQYLFPTPVLDAIHLRPQEPKPPRNDVGKNSGFACFGGTHFNGSATSHQPLQFREKWHRVAALSGRVSHLVQQSAAERAVALVTRINSDDPLPQVTAAQRAFVRQCRKYDMIPGQASTPVDSVISLVQLS